MIDLAQRECIPCKGGVPPLSRSECEALLGALDGDWELRHDPHDYIEKTYRFKNFRDALDYVNRVGELAERIGHHPDVYLSWGRVKLQIWTHKIGGLTESDFIFAAKCERL